MPTRLAEALLTLLDEVDLKTAAICISTECVRLCCSGSKVLMLLHTLEPREVPLILCERLDTFGLRDQVEVGHIRGRTDILEAKWRADSVLSF
jgi:hypothetical protein